MPVRQFYRFIERLNPLKSGQAFGPMYTVTYATLEDVSIPSNRGKPSDRHLPRGQAPSHLVSIPSNRGKPSDTERTFTMLTADSLNPLKSGQAFGPCAMAQPAPSPQRLNPLKSGQAFGRPSISRSRTILLVSIPSNRGKPSDKIGLGSYLESRRSQSPQIGASLRTL